MQQQFASEELRRVEQFSAALWRGDREPAAVVGAYGAPDFELIGAHPINHLRGADAAAAGCYAPIREALPDLERRCLLLFGSEHDGKQWVTAHGHFFGVLRRPLFGIPPTDRPVYLRFGEFFRLDRGWVEQVWFMPDWLGLMHQVGVFPLRQSLGDEILAPAPATQDGIARVAADQAESRKSLSLVEAMIDGLMRFDPEMRDFGVMEHDRFWHPDFMWYGPSGIGTTRGIQGFIDGHQAPFLNAFPDRKGGNHGARLAHGDYVATFGWPSLRATHAGGGWLGLAATGKPVTMRVADWWRRDGDRLAENWIWIDIPELLKQMGMDPFEHLPRSARHQVLETNQDSQGEGKKHQQTPTD